MRQAGSALFFCVIITTTAIVIAFGVMRASDAQRTGAVEANMQLLARGACESGTAHALRQIIEDHTSRPFTAFGGPASAPFVSHTSVYSTSSSVDGSTATRYGVDDIPASASPAPALWAFWWGGFYQFPDKHFTAGATSWDGRGRYWEVNLGWRSGAGADGRPTVNRRFGDAPVGTPDFNEPIYYDRQFRPVSSATQAAYRLRYAGGVMDLDSAILLNGDPGVDYALVTDTDPATFAGDPDLARLVRHQYAAQQIATMQNPGYNRTQGPRARHIYLNRGAAPNHDLRPGSTGFAPVTFPLMYRSNDYSAGGSGWIHHYVYAGSIYNPAAPPASKPFVSTRLFSYGGTQAVTGTKAGGEMLPNYGATGSGMANVFYRCLVGPQYSFNNIVWSSAGDRDEYAGGHFSFNSRDPGSFLYSPFGRGLRTGASSDHFTGPADTPWYGNIMTAPYTVLRAKIHAYMPQDVLRWRLSHKTTGSYTLETPHVATKSLQWKQLHPAFSLYTAPKRLAPAIDPDLDLPCLHPSSSSWNSPGSAVDKATEGWGWTGPEQRYPGQMCFNGYDSSDAFVHDTLGKYIDISDKPRGKDILSGGTFCARDAGIYQNVPSQIETWPLSITGQFNDPAIAATTYNGTNYNNWEFAPHPESWWDDILAAMANATAIARAQWMPYATSQFNPATAFDGAAWSGAKVSSIADFDALFVSCLGINTSSPSSTTPTKTWYGDWWGANFHSYTPSGNLASMVGNASFIADSTALGYSAQERTQVMELILNDFRLSMFGVSPDYWSTFRPLDFNGDGKIACSGYPVNGSATARESTLGISEYATGLAQPTEPFCVSGAWFVGHSRFWRIVMRGELWDNVLQRKASEALLETVICVDPADQTNELGAAAAQKPGGQYSTHVMFQRWHWDYNRTMNVLPTE